MGEKQSQPFQLSCNTSLKVDFQGSRVTSNGGLILVRELDGRLGFGELIEQHLPHSPGRQGRGKVSEARVEGGPVSGFGILRRGETGLFHGWCQHLALQTRLTFAFSGGKVYVTGQMVNR